MFIRLYLIFLLYSSCFSYLTAQEELFDNLDFSLKNSQDFLPLPFPSQNEIECKKQDEHQEDFPKGFSNFDHFESTLSAECEPLATIADCVNVVTGSFFQIEKDLKGTTIDPLDFMRYYDSESEAESFLGYGFGSGFPLWASDIEKGARHHYGLISERENFLLLYSDKEHSLSNTCKVDPRILEKGYTNLCKAQISGKTNFINWKALFRSKKGSFHDSFEWFVQLGDGTQRIYSKQVKMDAVLRSRMNFPTKTAYLLEKEIKPNGNQRIFQYQFIHGKPYLKNIQTRNRTDSATLNQLSFEYREDNCIIRDDCGQSVVYEQKEALRSRATPFGLRTVQRNFLTDAISSQKKSPLVYAMRDFTWKLAEIKKPGNQFLKIKYCSNGKIKSLVAPQDTTEDVTLYQFIYHHGLTEVLDAIGQLTAYFFDDHKRISHIQYVNQEKRIIREDSFYWSSDQNETGWLKAKSIGVDDHIHYLKIYEYDEKGYGNVTKETLYGNLTGNRSNSFKLYEKEKMDKSSLTYAYSNDGRNLLKEKSTSEGLTILYEYLENTNLCTKTLSRYKGKIQERIFQTYDENGELQIYIEDDGSSEDENNLEDVEFRKIKSIESIKEKGPSFGKPWKIYDSYLDKISGNVVLLKKTIFSYDSKGCERQREIIDSQGKQAITTKEYDSFLHLKKETNALQQTIQYKYDNNGNKTYEKLLNSGKEIYYNFDFANRLKEKKEVHKNGQEFATTYQYNALNQLISETDSYGHQTTTQYDRLGNQTHCTKPIFQNANGTTVFPTISKEYNLLNQATSITDVNGGVTTFSYNVYGSPVHIIYPDQSEEHSNYIPCGWLKEKHQADGTSIFYEYDAKGHLIEEKFNNVHDEIVKKEEYYYKGPLLRCKKDGMGLKTFYEYDGAGRKIKEIIGDLKTIHYKYDDFDRVIEKQEGKRVEITNYDLIGRPIEKKIKEDEILLSKEAYIYDIHDNLTIKKIWQSSNQAAIYQAQYQSDNSLEFKKDPLKNCTQYSYDHHTPYLGESNVKTVRILDPLNRLTTETFDPYHRLAKKEIFDNEQCVSCTAWSYDAAGNAVEEHVCVMENGQFIRNYSVERKYNKRGLLKKEIEMPTGKATEYAYDAMKRLKQKIKPDGVKLDYAYDALGRLKTLTSSDGTIDYIYHYDLHDNITQIDDRIHNITQNRSFDLYNRLTDEKINHGIKISYEYDALDRLKKLNLPDGSFIRYSYGPHLNIIQRYKSDDTIDYKIECPEYDLRRNLKEIHTPAGIIQHTHDLLGRTVGIYSPSWEFELKHFDAAGNLINLKQRDPDGIIHGHMTYDRFNHLTGESLHKTQYSYDSLGNCLQKNKKLYKINDLNQLLNIGQAEYSYDANGNLKIQTSPPASYAYDALNRLIKCEKEGEITSFVYDAFGRCLQITDSSGTRQLLYQGEQEIGSIINGQLQEFRLIHPESRYDLSFAIELKKKKFFPVQDSFGNICGLQKQGGDLIEWTRYTAFGEKVISGDLKEIFNPWRFANKREVANLSLFTHRFYNPHLMRWQTADPIGFKDGLNLYAYAHNNPFCYKDPDGRFAFVIPLLTGAFGAAGITITAYTAGTVVGCVFGSAVGFGLYQAIQCYDNSYNNVELNEEEENREEKKGKTRGKDNEIKGGPPRDRFTGNYLTDPAAEGTPHTTLGTKESRRVGSYIQGATFNEKREFEGRTDVTDHGRHDHPNPHFHPATGPNSADSQSKAIPEFIF